MMSLGYETLRSLLNGILPEGTPRRKVAQILSVVLIMEGISVLAMFSYAWFGFGLLSLVVGSLLVVLLYSGPKIAETGVRDPPGVRLVDGLTHLVGGRHMVMAIGAAIVLLVIAYNRYVSALPEIGDVDTLTIFFASLLVAYPFVVDRFRLETDFSLIFVGLVVMFLVVPQAVSGISDSGGVSSAGDWYVHYMLAAPFSTTLDLIGIPSSSSGNLVTLQFQDGTVQTLAISAYCAGLYSFSIFLSAFFSFVLVFERFRPRMLVLVLLMGLLVAYLGNLVRMVLIGVIGYYRGMDALRWAHENVGWIIFLLWSTAFWWLILRQCMRSPTNTAAPVDEVSHE